MKTTLIINGHPNPESFNYALANAYKEGALKTRVKLTHINIAALDFNPNLQYGYQKITPLEPDLKDAINKIKNADHIVWVFPMWWYSIPALMKGFIDRTFLPGITFEILPGKVTPKKLLKGKTARLIVTSDTPRWFNVVFMKSPAINQLKKGTLQFCGISAVKVTYIATIKNASEALRNKWLHKVKLLGEKQK